MKYNHPNDEEIQQYVLETSNGDDQVMAHMGTCASCQQKAAQYLQLLEAIKQQQKPVFEFNLAELVIAKLPKTRSRVSSEKKFSFFIFLISIFFIGVVFFLFGEGLIYLFSGITSIALGLIMTTVTCLFVLLWIDAKRKYQAKLKALNF